MPLQERLWRSSRILSTEPTLTGAGDHGLVEVGPGDLDGRLRDRFAGDRGDRVGLGAVGTGGAPDLQPAALGRELREQLRAQRLELVLVAPQVRDVDRHAVQERVELHRVLAQQLAVLDQVGRAAALGPRAHAALHLVALVLAEIDAAERAYLLTERDEVVGLEVRGERGRRRPGGRERAGRESHAPASRAI